MDSHTIIVAKGMDRICDDFSLRVVDHGFKRTKKRLWSRQRGEAVETIYLQRRGSSYGSPRTPSVDLRVMLSFNTPDGGRLGGVPDLLSDHARRPNGYAYHHRFNAETGSTYERCLEELLLFISEIAEPWFSDRLSTSPL
jgi:hypothetical protein